MILGRLHFLFIIYYSRVGINQPIKQALEAAGGAELGENSATEHLRYGLCTCPPGTCMTRSLFPALTKPPRARCCHCPHLTPRQFESLAQGGSSCKAKIEKGITPGELTQCSLTGVDCAPGRHLSMSRDVVGSGDDGGEGMGLLLASHGWRPGMLLNILQCSGQLPQQLYGSKYQQC